MKEIKKNLKLQYKRLSKVLEELDSLNKELSSLEGTESRQIEKPIKDAQFCAFESLKKLKLSLGLIDSTDKYQELPIFIYILDKYGGQDIELLSKVKHIMIDYPFKIENGGQQNVYEIKPTQSLRELISETQKVFVREYNAGKCIAPHGLEDFAFEHIRVYRNNCANIYFGS